MRVSQRDMGVSGQLESGGTRRRAAARWGASVVFVVSVLALLGTSPARWSVSAALVGPATAASGRGLELVVTSSVEPRIAASGPAKAYSRGVPCLSPWAAATRVTCLLPPGSLIEEVGIEGTCGGCTGPCVPPKGSFVTAESREVEVWKDEATGKKTLTVPAHAKDFIATTFDVAVEGAEYIEVELQVDDPSGGAPLLLERQSCRRHPTVATPFCTFLVYDSSLPKSPMTVELTAKASGWGRCGARGCSAPGTLRVGSIGATP